ncbi:hypothetical protein [Trinickia acidisoli]|uniref:hypothetical protein n=1 Tax=Trinickia acidisoli TaxID=2767482 RepID=UPI001A8CA5C1|nr:hypothetical protein [Trinickia acidisoli]
MTDPVVHVTNHASHKVCIAHDPNWDDQVLLVDGRAAKRTRCLAPGAQADVGIRLGADTEPEEYLIGVIFADGKDFDYGKAGAYQTTIGHHPDTGLLAVTDEHTIRAPSVQYSTGNQTQWSMDMTFVDSDS